jgi:fatty acid desaturase
MIRWQKPDWPTVAVLAAMYALLVGNALLYWTSPLPLVVHILAAAVAIHLAFTIWHEAAHGNVSRSARVNDVVGIIGMLPYMTPYFMQKYVHLQHHDHLNERGDPNLIYLDGSFWTLPLRYPRALAYAKRVVQDDPRSRGERISDAAFLAVVAGAYVFAWRRGLLLDVVLLWLVPLVLAKLAMDWYINYLPHIGLPADRFRGTRIVDVWWLTPLVLVHNYHAIHHLWPTIPWHRYRMIFRRKLEYLRQHDVPIEHRVFQHRPRVGALASQGS